MDTLGVGIIGFGFMGKVHTYGYMNIPMFYNPIPLGTKLVGIADISTDIAQNAADQFNFSFATDDWRKLIESDDIAIIDICSPNTFHAEQLIAAIKSGKHIYCEKPLVANEEETNMIEEALIGYKGIGHMALHYRFFPATLRAKQLIDEGFIGNAIGFRAVYLHSGSVSADKPMGWKQLQSAGGGVLWDAGPHPVDMIDYLIGPIESVFAEYRILYPQRPTMDGGMAKVEAEDQAIVLAKLSNGTMGTIEISKIATGAEDDFRFEIHGDKGAIRFSMMDSNYLEVYDLRDSETPLGGNRGWCKISTVHRYEKPAGFPGPKFAIGWIRGHMHCLYDFINSIAIGQTSEPSLQRGVHVSRILTTIEKSATNGNWQKVPNQKLLVKGG